MATFNKILAFNAASKSYNNVACDSNGYLNVNVMSGGGGGGGDASAANQLTQIQLSEDTLLSVNGINTKLNGLQHQSATYLIDAVATFAPDTQPQFTTPPAGIPLSDGWYFKNTGASQPSQLYYYSYLNTSLSIPARAHSYQLNDIVTGYAVVRLLSVNATAGLTTLAIYTRPEGSGDAAPWYRSRKVYTIPNTAKLTQGMKVMIYWGAVPDLRLYPDIMRIECTLSSSSGPCVGTELLGYCTLNTDSLAATGDAEYCVSAAGFVSGGDYIIDSKFSGESQNSGGGTYGNMLFNASFAPGASSNTINCTKFGETVISYSDTAPTNVGLISVYGNPNTSGSSWVFLGKLVPVANAALTKREAVAVLKLNAFSQLYALNDSATETHTGCIMSAISK